MTQVPEQTLSWLYSRLHDYHDPQRTYTDVARALSAYPSLPPRTAGYTYETGIQALLLNLDGTIPVAFRGTTYRFPIKLWIPQAYPQEPPMAYVEPGEDMVIRPGQHVGVDGRIYHPYLRDWSGAWDRATLVEFLEYLQQAFSREPPVISKAQQQHLQRPLGSGQPTPNSSASPAPPQLPPKPQASSARQPYAASSAVPPPRPPKPGEEYAEPIRDASRDGPPLPPLPHELLQGQGPGSSTPHQNGYLHTQRPLSQTLMSPAQGYQTGRPPGPPPLPQVSQHRNPHHPSTYRAPHERSPVSPLSPVHGYSELPETKYSYPAPAPSHLQQRFQQPAPVQTHFAQPSPFQSNPANGQPQVYAHQPRTEQQPPAVRKQPALDLLSDPFEVNLPTTSRASIPAPPIPPNPEKEHLLHAISSTLVQQAQQRVNQNVSAVAPLQAQQQALRSAHERLSAEIRQLEQLDQALSSNEAILHRSIQECDLTIANAQSKKQPAIDEVLIAPTLVANQLWTLCAEEAACREAMYVLQKAVDKGRVSGSDFVRQMRGLGRECFLKMALARKCAKGMGLETGGW